MPNSQGTFSPSEVSEPEPDMLREKLMRHFLISENHMMEERESRERVFAIIRDFLRMTDVSSELRLHRFVRGSRHHRFPMSPLMLIITLIT
jgi:hypothetical protein